jgi:hypothetical protein
MRKLFLPALVAFCHAYMFDPSMVTGSILSPKLMKETVASYVQNPFETCITTAISSHFLKPSFS